MQKSDFYYDLPADRIAQHHAVPRDSSKMMNLNRITGEIKDDIFRNIIDYLDPGDVLVVNNSKVIPARLFGKKNGDGADCEVLLLNNVEGNTWECIVKPGKRLKENSRIVFADDFSCEIKNVKDDGNRIIELNFDDSYSNVYEVLDKYGNMPVPHYISAPLNNNDEYQTVYADIPGSAAAPTAGLHFTEELLEKIRNKGISIAEVTLHVGLGTFRPVKEDNITDHKMHSETFFVTKETADLINNCKSNGGRVIGVGTTSCRTLESIATKYGKIIPCSESTDIFIYPGYQFKILDGLITNFHLPESTLIMLVSAFAGYEHTMNAYKYAVDNNYRFYSFGDAMLIL